MQAKLKKSCPQCTASSQKTYFQSIKALAKFAGRLAIPDTHKWLNGALLKKVRALPLGQFKRFSIAGVKALGAYGVHNDEKWHKAMQEASEKYSKMRMSGKRTKREAERWPKDGYASIRKVAKQLHEEVAHLGTEAVEPISVGTVLVVGNLTILLAPRDEGGSRGRSTDQRREVLDSPQRQEVDPTRRAPQDYEKPRSNRVQGGRRSQCCFQ